MVVIKTNDAVETKLHVNPKTTNEVLSQPIDVTQVRHVNNLHFADPESNVPDKTDTLLGGDVLEEIMLDDRIKDKGVVIRESLYGWIIFWYRPKTRI